MSQKVKYDAFRHRGEKLVWKCQSSARRAWSKIIRGICEREGLKCLIGVVCTHPLPDTHAMQIMALNS